MSTMPAACAEIADDLLAAAIGEASATAAARLERHLACCGPCRQEFAAYRLVDRTAASLRDRAFPGPRQTASRGQLLARLAELRWRLLRYRVFPSPFGRLLIARSEAGISAVEYLEGRGKLGNSRLARLTGVELAPAGEELEGAYRDLIEYMQGRRRHFDWPLDLRLVRSQFHRSVLEATAAIPYGAVASYAGLARELGRASAVRAVAQALRWNPLPIVIPCHRVVGSSGSLTGYAGKRVDLKRRLLELEGVPTTAGKRSAIPAIQGDEMYVRYPGAQAYCLPGCPALHRVPPAPLTRFASTEAAQEAGLAPCKVCRPDLHPLGACVRTTA